MAKVHISVPWMPKALSPNSRVNVFGKANAFKKYKNDVFLMVRSRMRGMTPVRHPHPLYPDGRVHIDLQFFPPARYNYDEDNMVASFKAGADGIRDAIGIDDHWYHYTQDVGGSIVKGGCVLITFEVEDGMQDCG